MMNTNLQIRIEVGGRGQYQVRLYNLNFEREAKAEDIANGGSSVRRFVTLETKDILDHAIAEGESLAKFIDCDFIRPRNS